MTFHDVKAKVHGIQNNAFMVERTQEISQSLLDRLKGARHTSTSERCGDYQHICTVPAIYYVKWLNQGFDVMKESEKAIVARMKREGLDHLMATEKSI